MSATEHARAVRALTVVLGIAVAVSIFHYTDNYLAFERYPQSDTGPTITEDSIWIAWIVFTAFGAAGYVLYRRGQVRFASALLAVYSISGLIGLGHYSAPGMSELAWWRHAHIGADFLSGVAVLAFAAWSLQRTRRPAYG